MSRTPTLSEIILNGVEQVLSNVHTSMPGRVESYDPAKQLAKVKPLFKRKYASEDQPVEMPIISNVPVLFPRSESAFIRMPISAGDFVQLIFNERSINRWMDSGEITDPQDPSKFDLNGAVAIVGLYPKSKPIEMNGAAGSLEIANGQSYIEIKEDGEISVTNGQVVMQIQGGNVKITATKITLESSNVNLGDESGQALALKSDLALIKYITPLHPGPPAPVDASACLGTQKVKAT